MKFMKNNLAKSLSWSDKSFSTTTTTTTTESDRMENGNQK